jgi:hypothetical protein
MIVSSPAEFLSLYSPERFPATASATARAAFLVTPTGFSLAAESARDNRYMAMQSGVDGARALAEHATLATTLRECLPTVAFPGDPATPDAVFPNNVFATVPGRAIIGSMRHGVRRREAERADIQAFFRDLLQYEIVDLSTQPLVAELTGAMVIDRARGIGWCGLSERCDRDGAEAMHRAFGLKLTLCFDLAPGEYHTNVVLALLASRAAIVAADGFADPAVVDAIAHVYASRVLRIDAAQKAAFAGNAITLDAGVVWMSHGAMRSLTDEQRATLARWGFTLRGVALDEIEKAGGSLRCCVGEIF